jgi:hypothetical protein
MVIIERESLKKKSLWRCGGDEEAKRTKEVRGCCRFDDWSVQMKKKGEDELLILS